MRVLFLSQIVPYPPHGGVLQRGYHLLRELGREASVNLLAFVHPDALPTDATLDDSRTALQKFCESVEYFPLWPKISPVHRVAALAAGACSSSPFSVLAHRSGLYQRRVSEILKTERIDVIHVDTIALSQFVPQECRTPVVLTHHNIESQLMERRASVEKGALAKWYLRRETDKLKSYEATLVRRYDVNIVVSRQDEETLLHMAPGLRTMIVPNGVDVEYFTLDPEQEASVRFFAVGQDPPKELKDFAARDPRVVITGYVTDIRPLVRKSSVYVVPLRVGGGTRLKVLDAMAMGKAMVSTSIGCEGIDLRPGEHLVLADTPEEFAKETVALLADKARRLRLGRAARSLVEERYSWRIIGQKLFDAYREAMATRRGAL